MTSDWKKSERENKNPLNRIMIQKAFIRFLIDNVVKYNLILKKIDC
jgi:hypothetical protein